MGVPRLPVRPSPALLVFLALQAWAAAQGSAHRSGGGGTQSAIVSRQPIDDLPGSLTSYDQFGVSQASLGDLDGDGRVEVAVGASGDDAGTLFDYVGAVWVFSLEAGGRVASSRKIAPGESGFTGELHPTDSGFGYSLEALGDLDGDGVVDLAVGAIYEGSVWILFLNADASVKAQHEIERGERGFGRSLAHLGDLDGDGRPELAVGHSLGDDEQGTVTILSLDPDGSVHAQLEIGEGLGGFGGALEHDDYFGSGLTELADLDGDLVPELAVGAAGDDDYAGAVWILFLNADGSVKAEQKIDDTSGGFTGTLAPTDRFGAALAQIDDADRDGLPELAVGVPGSGDYRGSVWILFLDSAGTVKAQREMPQAPRPKLRATRQFDGELGAYDYFGVSLAVLDDLDGDGVGELGVGTSGDPAGSCPYVVGGLWILFLDPAAGVKEERKLAPGEGLPLAVLPPRLDSGASLGDLDGNGVADLALGVEADCLDERGVLWILRLEDGATVAAATRIASGRSGFPDALAEGDQFGGALAPLGDLDLDGTPDLAVGAPGADLGGPNRGAVWILFLEADGTVREAHAIGQSLGGFGGALRNGDAFGSALGVLGDLDGDGLVELGVGAPNDDDGGANRGAVWILSLNGDGTVGGTRKISQTQGGFGGALGNGDGFGSAMAPLGDVDGDSVLDLAVGAPLHDTAVPDSGAVWTLLLNADGSVKGASTFDPTQVGFQPREDDFFGGALASSGDLDGNGEVDLIVGSPGDDGSPQAGDDNGVIWTASLAADGSPSSQARLLQGQIGIPFTQRRDAFGALVVSLPDMNADGVPDLAVGHGDYFRVWVFHQEGVARIEFETGDDFLAPLADGAEVSSTAHFGRVLEVDGYPTLGPSAAAFDSTPGGPNALGKDPDLLVGRGRVLILQEKPDQTVPGVYDVPDDDRFGGDFRFTFAGREVELLSLVLIDIDPAPGQGALVTLTDAEARERTYTVPAGFTEDIAIHGPPGYRTLDLTTLAPRAGFVATATAAEKPGFDPKRVVRLDVHLASSGALDGLVYDPYP